MVCQGSLLDQAGAAASTSLTTSFAFESGSSGTTLPTEQAYDEPVFYVRECYPVYYEMILRLLKLTRNQIKRVEAVTVSGTPGIGKSIFFAYFFTRYCYENETATIVTASFNKDSEMTQVVVWKDGELVDKAKMDKSLMIRLCLTADEKRKIAYSISTMGHLTKPQRMLKWFAFESQRQVV
ncbi:hypothetical protein PHYPSEUDO_013126 [Phytophthora pseudosyringae]|uniref:Uncharacterized protein n=1 Tax=Phytophthora pseudosyringae TaxID=221518 RepID=A0A8T1V8A3_9STRA|nr:hypothetical protein PHYPSEUDO_013126 [Phytophthora pseudosyringae]